MKYAVKYQNKIVVLFLFFFGFLALNLYYQYGISIAYGDAMSRLNIARKIIDNLTPGFAQIGNIWLPLPQIVMLPFIWNEFLWHSGIAGSIMSHIAYIVGGYYIYRSGKLLTKNSLASFLALTLYALNINMLYMQTTAMSESIFICFTTVSLYYFISWTKTNKLPELIKFALALNGITLTRYEGFAILLASVVLVALYSFLKHKSVSKAESDTLNFAFLAFLGFALWTLYLTLIFGDPLYWLHYYTAAQPVPTEKTFHVVLQHVSFFQALWKYIVAMVWMNGLIPMLYALLGMMVLLYKNIRKPSIDSLPLLMPFAIILFMILTMQKNTPINQPDLTTSTILSSTTNFFNEFNIRYGLIMLPFIALFSVYVFNVKHIALKILIYSLFFIQIYSYFYPQYSVIFQLPVNLQYAASQPDQWQYDDSTWLKSHYTGGLILVSTLKHDPQMFKLGLNYKTYIHEGTDQYWKKSIKDPTTYANWVWFAYDNKDDPVNQYLHDSPILKDSYTLVYNKKGIRIYKIKGKTRFDVKT